MHANIETNNKRHQFEINKTSNSELLSDSIGLQSLQQQLKAVVQKLDKLESGLAEPNSRQLSRLENIEELLRIILHRDISPEDERNDIDIEEVSRICNLSPGSVYNYLSNGKMNIPCRKKSGRVMLNRQDVLRWDAERFKVKVIT